MDEKSVIQYLNIDLDLVSDVSLDTLAKELDSLGVHGHVALCDDGLYYAMFEVMNDIEPEPNIAQLLDALDSLTPSSIDLLRSCSKFEFNVGYDCGDEPWSFNQGLSNNTLKRMADYGATFRITLYPHRCENSAPPVR